MEGAYRVGGQVDFDGKHEVRDQQAEGDVGAHITAEAEAADEEECPDGVGDVIDIKSIARAQAGADAGESASQAVARPVCGARQGYPQGAGGAPTRTPM